MAGALEEAGIVLPDGTFWRPDVPTTGPLPDGDQRGMVVNETDLPDQAVMQAVETYFEEHASVLGVNQGTRFQNYANEGSLLARAKFRAPANVIDEIRLARDLAERDDDVAATMGAMQAIAFGDGMQNIHRDAILEAVYDEIAKHANLDAVFNDMYRELLIAGSMTTVQLFTRESFSFLPQGEDQRRTRSVIAPLIGVLPAENIRVLDNDMFSTGTLAYKPVSGAQETWLREFFADATSAARRAEMRREDPVLTTLLVEEIVIEYEAPSNYDENIDLCVGNVVYRLNPRMVRRTTLAKGAWKYPRPLLTRNFALLEAKRLLNIMDFALLQGGSNFLVVAKKGSDQRPAMPEEVTNLREQVRRASRTGVMVGDHRLSIEIITPELGELLNPAKRKVLGRKISGALLRVPDFNEAGETGQAVLSDTEILARVISSDRRMIRRHVERVYDETADRNPTIEGGPAGIWFPKIVLQGLQFFTDLVLKLRDRGDISRRSAVAAGGFDYDAEVQARRREKPDDRVMTPAMPPAPPGGGQAGPQDNNGGQGGRPQGGGSSRSNGRPGSPAARGGSGQDPARRRQVVQRNAGETVRAMYEEEVGDYRVGEQTYSILEQFPDRQIGRLTTFERASLDEIAAGNFDAQQHGPVIVVPVNPEEELDGIRAVRLAEGLTMLTGERSDGALMARAFCFREDAYDPLSAQETALRWGFDTDPLGVERPEREEEEEVEEEHASTETSTRPMEIHLHVPNQPTQRFRTVVTRDDSGNITGTEQVPIEPEGS